MVPVCIHASCLFSIFCGVDVAAVEWLYLRWLLNLHFTQLHSPAHECNLQEVTCLAPSYIAYLAHKEKGISGVLFWIIPLDDLNTRVINQVWKGAFGWFRDGSGEGGACV